MNEQTRHALQENLYRPANRVMKAVCDKPYSTVAALATFGIGMALLIPGSRRRLASSMGMAPAGGKREISAPESSYYDPAPRSIYGSHRSFEEFAGPAPPGEIVKRGSYLLGSAALLTTLYLLGRNGGFVAARKEP